MTKPLRRLQLLGMHPGVIGDVSDLRGNVSGLWGDVDQIPASARPCDIADWIEP